MPMTGSKLFGALLALTIVSCSDNRPVRDVTTPDTDNLPITPANLLASGPVLEDAPSDVDLEVQIMPGNADLELGAQALLEVFSYSNGARVPSAGTFTWSSLDPSIATVDESGVITAQGVGVTGIVADETCCGRADTAIVVVRQVPVSIELSTPSLLVATGGSALLAATVKDLAGRPMANVAVSWSSSDAEIASVDQGMVTGRRAGAASIYVTVAGISASAVATVTSESQPERPGDRSPSDETPDEGRPPSRSDDERPSDEEGPSDQAPSAAVLNSIAITPASALVAVGGSAQLRAVALDQNGRSMSGQSFAWSSSNPAVATVNAMGVVQGIVPGTVLISASTGGKITSAQLTVSSSPAPAPPPTPLPNGSFSQPDIAATDFSTGTSAPFTVASGSITGNVDLNIMPDPTGLMVGQVARIHYVRSSPAFSPDVNRALQYHHTVHHGETIFFRGRILIPTPAMNMMSAMRKLFYVQTGGPSSSFCVIKADGQSLKAEITNSRLFRIGSISYGRPFSVEAQITANSAPGVPDGIFRVWLDGTLAVDQTNVEWIDPQSAGTNFSRFLFGQQTQMDAATTFDEYRYWDNIAMSTMRIGP
jgi:uncharacterized protein YjdB